mgnify:CR=1 FL=1
MIQTPGKAQTPGTDVVTQKTLGHASQKPSIKRSLRMIGAGLISATLVGVFAMPAYASTEGSDGSVAQAEEAFAQALTTSALPEINVPDQLPSAEEQPAPVVVAAAAAGAKAATPYGALPAGVGSSGIVNAAMAQIGMDKDCTDVAQDALAAVGLVTSRFDGGYDMGVGSFASLGTVYAFSPDGLAPGDILVYPGIPHVAIYAGGGQVVHGGWHPTTLAGFVSNGVYPDYVVRVV